MVGWLSAHLGVRLVERPFAVAGRRWMKRRVSVIPLGEFDGERGEKKGGGKKGESLTRTRGKLVRVTVEPLKGLS